MLGVHDEEMDGQVCEQFRSDHVRPGVSIGMLFQGIHARRLRQRPDEQSIFPPTSANL
jgi:hypothetical protein